VNTAARGPLGKGRLRRSRRGHWSKDGRGDVSGEGGAASSEGGDGFIAPGSFSSFGGTGLLAVSPTLFQLNGFPRRDCSRRLQSSTKSQMASIRRLRVKFSASGPKKASAIRARCTKGYSGTGGSHVSVVTSAAESTSELFPSSWSICLSISVPGIVLK